MVRQDLGQGTRPIRCLLRYALSMPATPLPLSRRLGLGAASLAIATAIWLPCLHLVYAPSAAAGSVPARAQRMAARQLELFRDQESHEREAGRMRRSNPEWDFMGRTFLVYALADLALRDPAGKARHLEAIDRILDDTLRLEREQGLYYFLMPYARHGEFVISPARSQFLDGEIALMLGLRRLLGERPGDKARLTERVEAMIGRMEKSPVLSAESYPDECWTFCNALALAAIKAADVLDGTDHTAFFRAWIEAAKARLVEPTTGLLISSYTLDGRMKDGPEGSSLWMSAHALRVIDPAFAEDQYRRAKKELGRTILGFGYAREWPSSHRGPADVDSGPVIPGLDVSGGSSGLALVAASSFGDRDYFAALGATLDFAAFPTERDGRLSYAASNQVGDAVMLYSMVLGPMWSALEESRRP